MPTNESNDLCKLVDQEPLLVLLGGATCGGKSTLANQLQQTWINCKRLSQDDYFREEEDPEHVWVTLSDGRRHQNWEHLQSVDWSKMKQAVRQKIESFTQVSGKAKQV
jgi:nicotinamide/nicotinate riboside kinase